MENQQYIQEDEIDIREYINVIIKRKMLILALVLVSVITAASISLKMPKVYEITSTIQLGSFNELLIKNEEVKAIILNKNLLLSVINELGLKMGVESLQKAIKISDLSGTNLLTIKITYPGIDTAFKIHNAVINPLITKGQVIYQERKAILNERLRELDAEIKSAEGDIIRTQAMITNLPEVNNVSQSDVSLRIILLQNSLPNYETSLTALRDRRNDLKLLLGNSKDFLIFDKPVKAKNPISPNKKKNILIAGVFSFILGVFLAFVLEFRLKCKKEEKK